MKRLLPAVTIVLAWATAAFGAAGPLTSVRSIQALTSAEAGQGLPVAFEATVTYFRGYQKTLFVQDGSAAILVTATTNLSLAPGDRVLVKGTTHASFRTNVVSSDIALLGHGPLPQPVAASFDDLIQGRRDSMLVTMRGVVHSADLDLTSAAYAPSTTVKLLADGGTVNAVVNGYDAGILNDLIDASVEITAVAGSRLDGKMQQTGVVLQVARLGDIKILKRADASPWTIPVTPMNEIMKTYHVKSLTRRVRVHGSVTYYEPGSALVLQDGARSLWVKTESFAPMQMGDMADATGFPAVDNGYLVLSGSEIQDDGTHAPVAPQLLAWMDLTSSKHSFDLVSIEGYVVMEAREATQDEYILVSGGNLFSAVYRHSVAAGAGPLAAMKQFPVGSKIRVSGICVLDNANPFSLNVPFSILLRSPGDLEMLARPSWLNTRHLIFLVGLLLLAVGAMGVRSWTIERMVRRQTAEMAYIERRRSRILEDINGARPLAEIIEQITELVSFSLKGAPCWTQVADGAQLGNSPEKHGAMRIIQYEILARTGPPLGAIFAAFDPRTKPRDRELKALAMAAGLATLAIETRRLYSDLLHRSEFDLLTDIQNRFSMERSLDAMIHAARESAGVFGLIYIDLNGFKQVNDIYGHQVGDQYLQDVAQRMKGQLRPGDTLARLGGDEFAALVRVVRNRSEVEEIALRLERCFDEPFTAEGCVVNGSASIGIALYPVDANTRDSLLSAADAAMYAVKNTRQRLAQMVDASDSEFTSERRT